VKRLDLMRNVQLYMHSSTRLRNRSYNIESVVVYLQLDEAENAGARPAVAKSKCPLAAKPFGPISGSTLLHFNGVTRR